MFTPSSFSAECVYPVTCGRCYFIQAVNRRRQSPRSDIGSQLHENWGASSIHRRLQRANQKMESIHCAFGKRCCVNPSRRLMSFDQKHRTFVNLSFRLICDGQTRQLTKHGQGKKFPPECVVYHRVEIRSNTRTHGRLILKSGGAWGV